MKLFALADLHLSGSSAKPMDVFGPHWKDHQERIGESWSRTVAAEDTVLLAGDISWAMTLEEALPDLEWIGALPGRKIMIKGNHDYWWSSLTRLKERLPESITPLQNTAVDIGYCVIAGARGWLVPESREFSAGDDMKLLRREEGRLRLSLDSVDAQEGDIPLVVMMHYPPVYEGRPTEFSDMIRDSGAGMCVYGHLHASPDDWPPGVDTVLDGVEYRLVSADRLDFRPSLLLDADAGPSC